MFKPQANQRKPKLKKMFRKVKSKPPPKLQPNPRQRRQLKLVPRLQPNPVPRLWPNPRARLQQKLQSLTVRGFHTCCWVGKGKNVKNSVNKIIIFVKSNQLRFNVRYCVCMKHLALS